MPRTSAASSSPARSSAWLNLRAGPLELRLDPRSGFVRRIRWGEREVLRGIYAAVRDHNWDTVAPELRFISRQVTPRAFKLEFECAHRRGDIQFVWRGRLEGSADGTVEYDFDGEAHTTFRKNRIGFCVLHPIRECAGAWARQVRSDGAEREARFPDAIEPQIFGQSPFRDLRSITHRAAPGWLAQVEFAGDVFEMEDQRNWTDASFKTYCTPLLAPFPVTIAAGGRIRQRVVLRLIPDGPGHRPAVRRKRAGAIPTLNLPAAPTGSLPSLGLGVASHGAPLTPAEIAHLRALQLAHLRADVRPGQPAEAAGVARALRQAAQLQVPLELAVHLPARGQVDPRWLLALLRESPVPVARVLALREGEPATSAGTLAWARRHLGELAGRIGAGSDCNFRELNHEHAIGQLGLAGADVIFWSVNPQVHAFDDLSIMETLEAQPATVQSARALAGGRPLVVSPVTLRQRFNPVATGAAATPARGELPAAVDPRQREQFAAAWTLGSIAALAAARVESITYFETTGWRGVMERTRGSPLPKEFPSRPGELFPVYAVLAGLAGFRQVAVADAGEGYVALTLFAPGRSPRAMIGNLQPEAKRVRVRSGSKVRLLRLLPYAVVQWDQDLGQ